MRNYLHAIVYYRRGCQLHSNTNCIMLANIKGRMGSEILLKKLPLQDKALALEYLHSACFGGDAEACANLGVLYFNGYVSDNYFATSTTPANPATPDGQSTLTPEVAAAVASTVSSSAATAHAVANMAADEDYHPQQMLTAAQLLTNMQHTAQRLQQEQHAAPVRVDLFALVAARLPEYKRNSGLNLSLQDSKPEVNPYSSNFHLTTLPDDSVAAQALVNAMASTTNTATGNGSKVNDAEDNSQLSLRQLEARMHGSSAAVSLQSAHANGVAISAGAQAPQHGDTLWHKAILSQVTLPMRVLSSPSWDLPPRKTAPMVRLWLMRCTRPSKLPLTSP